MKTYRIAHTGLEVSRIAYGCMHLSSAWDDNATTSAEGKRCAELVELALQQGINLFDHADIYARGKGEKLFGDLLHAAPSLRQRMVLQSKCGIRFAGEPHAASPARYDFSHQHLTASVEGILQRLRTDYLDVLLLHRPDPLAEPAEVARAFDDLQRSGKVRHFGVSNYTASQIALLQKHLDTPLVINQVEISLLHHYAISETLLANQLHGTYAGATGTLDHCRLHGILVQAWSPLAGGKIDGSAASLAAQFAAEKQVSVEAILLAWLLAHPAGLQPIIGTTNPARLTASCQADAVNLSRDEWYGLLQAARGAPVP